MAPSVTFSAAGVLTLGPPIIGIAFDINVRDASQTMCGYLLHFATIRQDFDIMCLEKQYGPFRRQTLCDQLQF
ncbi:hypothetical protein SCLCIDRAFT_20395 [Scleroderma citrinum Foug A]|uniref:Uncharacterized protein n=1 Tax=Scleroderma citrinum Foug A TaxID=1036808 RepID=A0A0C3EKL1_9AGAM|nr:hypothetical protein SCLCIDRAFT_20395 [Scleroderma citrinum Foug A]